MADKIKLLEADIDVESILKKGADTQKQIEFLKNESKFFQESIKEGKKLIESYNDALQKMEAQGKKNSKQYDIADKNLKTLTKSQESNRQKLELVNSELRKEQKNYANNKRVLDAYNKTVNDNLGIISKTDGSINQLNQALGNNRKIYRDLTKEQRENSEIGGRLKDLINQQDKEYKSLQKSIGTTQVEVGNYKEQIKEALSESGEFSKSLERQISEIPVVGQLLNSTTKYLRTYAQGQIASANATSGNTKALKVFKVALVSTGIGAIIVLLGLFATALSKSQRFTDFFTQTLAPLKGAFEAIIGILQDLAFNIEDVVDGALGQFKDNFTIVKNRFLNGVDEMRLAWNKLTGDQEEAAEIQDRITERQNETADAVARTAERWEKVKEFASDSLDRIKEGVSAQQEIARLAIEIENRENQLILTRSELNKQIKEYNKIAEDVTKTEAEREAAAIRSIELSKQLVAEEQSVLDLKIRQKELENSINETSREDQKELNELIAERNEKETQGLELQTTQQNKLNTIRQSAEAERQKAADDLINKSREQLDLFIAQEGEKAKTLEKSLVLEESIRDKRLDILKKELDSRKISQTKYETEVINIKRDFLDRQNELTFEHLEKELDIYIAQNRSKIENDTLLTDSLVSVEESRLQEIYDRRIQLLNEQRNAELISEQDFILQKLGLETDFLTQKKELEDNFKAQQKEQEQIDYENSLETRRLRGESEFILRLEEIQRQRAIEIAEAEKTGADVQKVKEKFAAQEKSLEQEVNEFKLTQRQAIVSGLRSIFGEESKLGKAFAIADITNTTVTNAAKAFTQAAVFASNPITAPLAVNANIQGGIIIATGAAQIAKTVLPKAEDGMAIDIGGKSHSEGGTKFFGSDGTAFEAQKGEKMFVLNRKASAALGPLLSDVNMKHGGVSLSKYSHYLASGGQILRGSGGISIPSSNNPNIDYDLLAITLSEANRQLPAPRVAIEDINTGQGNYAQVVSGANI